MVRPLQMELVSIETAYIKCDEWWSKENGNNLTNFLSSFTKNTNIFFLLKKNWMWAKPYLLNSLKSQRLVTRIYKALLRVSFKE